MTAARRGLLGLLLRPLLIIGVLLVLHRWIGSIDLDSIESRTVNAPYLRRSVTEHVRLTVVATTWVIAVGIPVGILLTRAPMRRVTPAIMAVVSTGQAVPAYGLMVLLSLWLGVGFRIAAIALAVYAFLPLLRNVVTGLRSVDPAELDAARGMGMSRLQILRRVELPLAVPLVLAGVRTALVISAGVATLATFVNAGGLGDIVINGIKLNRTPVLVTGSVLCACVALTLDWLGALAEHLLTPRGLR